MRAGALSASLPCLRDVHAKAVASEIRPDRAQDRGLVVDERGSARPSAASPHASPRRIARRSMGSVKGNTAPPSGRFRTEMRPPCASTRPRATASPSPVPRGARAGAPRKNGSKSRSIASSAMPGPSSATSTTARRACDAAQTTMRRAGRRVTHRVLDEIGEDLVDLDVVQRHRREVVWTAPRADASCVTGRRRPTTSSISAARSYQLRSGRSVPDSMRDRSSRLPTMRLRRRASCSMSERNSRARRRSRARRSAAGCPPKR